VMRVGGGPVQSYNDILEELESNPKTWLPITAVTVRNTGFRYWK